MNDEINISEIEFKQKVKLIGLLGSAFHRYGTSAERLEECLKHITISLGLKGNFFSTPTYLTVSLNSGEDQITRHIRSLPADVHLGKLQDLDTIAEEVLAHEISYSDAITRLNELEAEEVWHSKAAVLFAFAFTSMSLSLIFGGTLIDAGISFLMGTVVGILTNFKIMYSKISESYEFLAAFLAAFGSCVLFHYGMAFNFENVLISSLIIILPGLSLTIAMKELASQNLVSGTARLMGSLIGLLKIAFGIFLAAQLNKIFFSDIVSPPAQIMSQLWIVPAMIITSLTFAVIFNAKKADYIWVLFSGIVSFGSLKLSGFIFNEVLSIFIAAVSVGVFSNVVARVRNKPSLVTLLPGIIFLVPGSVGIKGLNLLFEHNLIAGIDGSIKMFILSTTIVTGLLIANVFVSPRKGL